MEPCAPAQHSHWGHVVTGSLGHVVTGSLEHVVTGILHTGCVVTGSLRTGSVVTGSLRTGCAGVWRIKLSYPVLGEVPLFSQTGSVS